MGASPELLKFVHQFVGREFCVTGVDLVLLLLATASRSSVVGKQVLTAFQVPSQGPGIYAASMLSKTP